MRAHRRLCQCRMEAHPWARHVMGLKTSGVRCNRGTVNSSHYRVEGGEVRYVKQRLHCKSEGGCE